MIYSCCDERRREAVRKQPDLNGIDFLEVLDGPELPDNQRQRKLFVHFLNDHKLTELDKNNFRISGGERVRNIEIIGASVDPQNRLVVVVRVAAPGDFSIYTLHLVADADHPEPPREFDPQLSEVDFSFKAECAADFDCLPRCECPVTIHPPIDIDYLAKDFASLRQLMLDRLATTLPQWSERSPADAGMALVELLAYVGDHLSYRQDAIATEAALGTARRRVSVRRHARLVDYLMHDGCNARTWIHVRVAANEVPLRRGTQLMTRLENFPDRIPLPQSASLFDRAVNQRPEVFETMHDALLFQAHNEMRFYTWGDEDCCLPRHATQAVLRDDVEPERRLRLRPGDVLVFEERIGPRTGKPGDAAASHRHAVRLTRVHPAATAEIVDGREARRVAGPPLVDPLNGEPYVEIEWSVEDALPFPLCLSASADAEHGGQRLSDVSVILGNIVLADHGRSVQAGLPAVPPFDPELTKVPVVAGCHCDAQDAQRELSRPTMPRYRPILPGRPLTQAATSGDGNSAIGISHLPPSPLQSPLSAAAARQGLFEQVLPSIYLEPGPWLPRRDLLSSDALAREFVVEIESDGTAALRFGDGVNGRRPVAGTQFVAHFRVGNGTAGNVGAESIAHIVSDDSNIELVRNPLPAIGGHEPESMQRAKQFAPSAFRRQERAVTESDYAEVAQRFSGVQRAAATFRWTGSWQTVFVTVDRLNGLPVDARFEQDLRAHLQRFRMAGHDLEIDAPRYVSLDIVLHVCVRPDFFRSSVQSALLEVFSNRVLPSGQLGVFHPDNFSFGQPVFLSRLYAAAQAVTGVADVRVVKFERQGRPSIQGLNEGQLTFDRLEIARLDNDPNFREHGLFDLILEGGK